MVNGPINRRDCEQSPGTRGEVSRARRRSRCGSERAYFSIICGADEGESSTTVELTARDWDYIKGCLWRFFLYITDNRDFYGDDERVAGRNEMNASHTACRFYPHGGIGPRHSGVLPIKLSGPGLEDRRID